MAKPKHKSGERWGLKYVDRRDWAKTNEELVVRGEFLLDLEWVKSGDKELEEMNKGKRGRPYEFPVSLCLVHFHSCTIARNTAKTMLRQLKRRINLLYSTINRGVVIIYGKLSSLHKLPSNTFHLPYSSPLVPDCL